MSDNKTYRIKANVGQDSMLNVNLNQDYKTFELLSLKIDSDNLYKFHTSDYGCVAGRVLANGNFGIPNAKISIFIKATEEDLSDAILSYLYPYKNTRIKNEDGVRYNLLPDEQLSDCHRNVGTFPNKRLVLDDNNVFEVYDKYYKYTTRTNNSGDYMIFGVPVGEQTIHVDIDLSDIGILSQRPRDMIYKGYSATQFENANMFKKSTDLDTLTQIISQNSNVYVYPFWGETSEGDVAITRKDIEIQYVFEPTCVFMGSMITDEKSNAISKNCVPSERMGKMDRLTTGNGTIEMIRKKPDGSVEELIVQGNQLIDGNGVWCYQIPMNLDYVCTDEYGNIVPTDDPKKGIPTRTRVRFRMSFTEFEDGTQFSHAAKTLVPNNPQKEADLDYAFGTNTLDDEFATKSFRDLFWNKVYSIKSYIPRFQQGNYNRNKRFSGIKEVNVNGANNPMPYNNMRVDISFMFMLQCAIFHILLKLVMFFNKILGILYSIHTTYKKCGTTVNLNMGSEMEGQSAPCVFLGDGYCPDLKGWYFAPGCDKDGLYNSTFKQIKNTKEEAEDNESIESENGEEEKVCLTRNIKYFIQCTEINMAMEYDVIQFDFYNDWVNGVIYSPRWNADMRKKRSYLFGIFRVSPRLNACSEENFTSSRRLVQQCALQYGYDGAKSSYTTNATSKGCVENSTKQRCHKGKGRKCVSVFGSAGGAVHREPTSTNSNVYYYKPCEWKNDRLHLFFATDIILLGSLNENDEQGIPQTFTKLVSSTYQLPDALASTNIGAEGFLYGYSGGGALCNKSLGDEGVTIHEVDNSFDGLVNWSKDGDVYEVEPYDDPRPITETSGIDWGFSGPEQGKNNFNNLYYPGGHFLGISCTWSEVNVKSCINLSRICELGSTISHRKSFIVKDDRENYKYIDSIPTGLISGDEILDYSGKNEFATLNYNRLLTKRNAENNLLEYDFRTIHPINFNGELSSIANSDGYYKRELMNGSFRRTIEENSSDYYHFRMGLNGDETREEQKKHFLINYGSNVSMPIYKNSFYFYFGISNGNTALDRLNKEFFAECPKYNAYIPEVSIIAEDVEPCNIINGKCQGVIKITTVSVENPKLQITGGDYNITGENYRALPYNSTTDLTAVTGEEYTVTVYGDNINGVAKKIKIGIKKPENLNNIVCTVTDFTEGIYYDYNSFSSDCDTSITGYVKIEGMPISDTEYQKGNVVAAMITADRKCHYVYKKDNISYGYPNGFSSANEINYGSISGGRDKCYLWEGNETYDVYVKIYCGTNDDSTKSYSQWILIDSFYADMPVPFDVIFNGDNNANYQRFKKYISGGRLKINNLFDKSTELGESVCNSLKQAVYYRNSKYDIDASDNIEAEVIVPAGNRMSFYYVPETLTENTDGDNILQFYMIDRLSNDENVLRNIYMPNEFLPKQGASSKMLDIGSETFENSILKYKGDFDWFNGWMSVSLYFKVAALKAVEIANPYYNDYEIRNFARVLTTVGKTSTSICKTHGVRHIMMDMPYLPFFFKALFIIDDTPRKEKNYLSLSIVNGIKENNKYKRIKVCDVDITSDGLDHTENKTYSKIGEDYAKYKNSFCIEDIYPVDSVNTSKPLTGTAEEIPSSKYMGQYKVLIEEFNGKTISKSITAKFIGDKYGDGENDFYRYAEVKNSKISYYHLSSSIQSYYFRSYFNFTGGSSTKEIVSNKGRYFYLTEDGNFELYSPYFPGWDIGKISYPDGTNVAPILLAGSDAEAAKLWPRFSSRSYNAMWSTWYNLMKYKTYTKWTDGLLAENEVMGTALSETSDTGDVGCVVGIYDENFDIGADFHSLANGDPLSSTITVVRMYSVANFNELRRKMGLVLS